jgi:hypothetical protein
MRLRPPRRWKRIGMRTTGLLPSSRGSTLLHTALLSTCGRSSPTRLARPSALIRTSRGVLLQIHPLHQELDDARLLRREQLLAPGGRARRTGSGRSRHHPEAVIRDRSYSSWATRRDLRRRGIRPSILRGEPSSGSTSWTGTLA